MKFYFCEGCGQRITEKDIAAGEGRDKKLKGVYCQQCAVGVTTMESLPVSAREAKALVREEEANNLPRPARRSSGYGLPTPGSSGTHRSRSGRRKAAPRETGAPHVKWVVPAVVSAILMIAVLMAVNARDDSAVPGPKSIREHKKVAGPRVSEKPRRTPTSKAESRPQPRPPTKVARPDNPLPATSPASKPEDRPIDPNPSTHESTPNREPKVPEAKPPVAKVTEASTPPADAEQAREKLSAQLIAFDEAVSHKEWATANRIAGRAQSDPALKPFTEQVEALVKLGRVLADKAAARQKALEALPGGQKRTFQTRKRKVTGVVRKVEGETLRITVTGTINKQVVEYERRVKLRDLTPACRAELLGEKAPASADEWMAEAVLKIAAKDGEAAARSLGEAGNHPLSAHYGKRLEAIRAAHREVAAKREWGRRISSLLKNRTFTKAAAERGLRLLESFRASHGKTAFAASVAEQSRKLETTIRTVLKPKELKLDLGGGLEMVFILIPPGTFVMGDKKRNGPQHKVTISRGFCLGKFEVTKAQYERVMKTNPSPVNEPDLPIAKVSWNQCKAFCNKLSKMTDRMARLPTEAEWEYACRAGTATAFSFGDSRADLGAYGWYSGNAGGKAHPVGRKRPNAWGLHDMHGNVWEWCQDFQGPYTKEPATDPKGPATGKERIRRGGCWSGGADGCYSARRSEKAPGTHTWSTGFRVALDM